jgi:hypothetical protein
MKSGKLIILLILSLLAENSFSQTVSIYVGIQDSLTKVCSIIWKQKTDSGRLQANDNFFRQFHAVLNSKSYVSDPFDSIIGITHVASQDGKLRIYTWNVPLSDGTNKYFGFIKLSYDSLHVIQLQSTEHNGSNFETEQFIPQSWYGAIYYKLIQEKIGENQIYTLLGWDGYTANSNRKMIDILSLDKYGNIAFGMPIFKTDKGIKSRVVMEYAEKAGMLLRYDYQAIKIQKRKKIKKEDTWLIVMDRMIPMDASMAGNRMYYVPAGDTYDGFVFINGFWVLAEDIEVTNRQTGLK